MKNALITGGSSGIGFAIAQRLIEEGNWNVISVSRSREKIDQALALVPHIENKIEFLVCDVGDAQQCNRLYDMVKERFDTLHGLVNNAGMLSSGGLVGLDPAQWTKTLEVNLSGPYFVTRALLPLLKNAKGASVINISSIASKIPGRSIAYSVSKAGLDMFTEFLAGELGPMQIRVNSINPGLVETNLHLDSGVYQNTSDYKAMLQDALAKYPLARLGKPHDVASLARFLLSDESLWITGAIIKIDGGVSVFNELLNHERR